MNEEKIKPMENKILDFLKKYPDTTLDKMGMDLKISRKFIKKLIKHMINTEKLITTR